MGRRRLRRESAITVDTRQCSATNRSSTGGDARKDRFENTRLRHRRRHAPNMLRQPHGAGRIRRTSRENCFGIRESSRPRYQRPPAPGPRCGHGIGPPRLDGKIKPSPRDSVSASHKIASARSLNGTRCSTPAFIRLVGTVQVADSRSISRHVEPRASPDRAAVKIKNSRQSVVDDTPKARIRLMASPTWP